MATTERPKSRLPGGGVNPAYTAWRKANIPRESSAEHIEDARLILEDKAAPLSIDGGKLAESVLHSSKLGVEVFPSEGLPVVEATEEQRAAALAHLTEDFQSAAEPEQTTNDDPREPEVAPALEAPLADGDLIEIKVDRLARNKSFVYGDLNGELVPIRAKKKTGHKLVGKPINVLVTIEAGHTLYTHAP